MEGYEPVLRVHLKAVEAARFLLVCASLSIRRKLRLLVLLNRDFLHSDNTPTHC